MAHTPHTYVVFQVPVLVREYKRDGPPHTARCGAGDTSGDLITIIQLLLKCHKYIHSATYYVVVVMSRDLAPHQQYASSSPSCALFPRASCRAARAAALLWLRPQSLLLLLLLLHERAHRCRALAHVGRGALL